MSIDQNFQKLSVSQAAEDLPRLCAHVATHCGRVEIISTNDLQDCVLISKAELQSLENALEMLADSQTTRDLSEHLSQLAQLVEPRHSPV